ncbi:MAG: protein-N(pi)-phosphohistidine--sugar phosphotransferase, partial [Lachnospiraceae bacterium]|nr:protein-N(pi)-phosphohistidine--sugar phosphotransferase [Lachnospiraceae bacterium]
METRQKQNSDGKKIRQIYVVCDAGLGSSAMGAALFRRTLREAGADQVKVSAAAADEIPADGDLLVCQKDFYRQRLQEMEGHLPEIYPVDSLTGRGEYALLLEKIKGRL